MSHDVTTELDITASPRTSIPTGLPAFSDGDDSSTIWLSRVKEALLPINIELVIK
jgi:hypothetical protein